MCEPCFSNVRACCDYNFLRIPTKSSSSEVPMVNLVAGPSVPSPSAPSDGRGGGTRIMLLSTFSETMTGMEFMVRERLNLRRSPDFLTDAATAGALGCAELTLVADDVVDVEVDESLLAKEPSLFTQNLTEVIKFVN